MGDFSIHLTMCASKHLSQKIRRNYVFPQNHYKIKPVFSPTVRWTFYRLNVLGSFLDFGIHSSKCSRICSRIFYSFVFYVKSIIAFQPPDISRVCKNLENDFKSWFITFVWCTFEPRFALKQSILLDHLQYHPLKLSGQRRTRRE